MLRILFELKPNSLATLIMLALSVMGKVRIIG